MTSAANRQPSPFEKAAKTRSCASAWRAMWFLLMSCMLAALPAFAGNSSASYKVQPAITHAGLAIFPVVGSQARDTSGLMTLDEGVRSGEVVVSEAGDTLGLVRPRPVPPGPVRPEEWLPQRRGIAQVNRLVLYNNSSRPLLLLAGEIVTGGKQDRVIGADRIVPPHSGPIDLGVFCVEPGRWAGAGTKFSSMGAQMAQPSVRTPAMAAKDQSKVWERVGIANREMAAQASAAPAPSETSSYAQVFNSAAVQKKIAEYGGTEQEQRILRELRAKAAVGVVVAVNGRVIWADIFASTDLLAKYWPKLYKSYVSEAMTSIRSDVAANQHDAQTYIDTLQGGREVVETEPGVYRRSEVTGDGYRVFALTSLLPKAQYEVHVTKMRG